jgi:hypothetical protein
MDDSIPIPIDHSNILLHPHANPLPVQDHTGHGGHAQTPLANIGCDPQDYLSILTPPVSHLILIIFCRTHECPIRDPSPVITSIFNNTSKHLQAI